MLLNLYSALLCNDADSDCVGFNLVTIILIGSRFASALPMFRFSPEVSGGIRDLRLANSFRDRSVHIFYLSAMTFRARLSRAQWFVGSRAA